MRASARLVLLALLSVLSMSCGGDSSPAAPVPLVEYAVSGAAESADAAFSVDDDLSLFVNGQSVGTWNFNGKARFQARPGDTLRVQAVDTCQGQYWVSALWVHRSGIAPSQITGGVQNCSVASVPCLPVDCAAADRVFLDLPFTLP
jgi:hypothetical protein